MLFFRPKWRINNCKSFTDQEVYTQPLLKLFIDCYCNVRRIGHNKFSNILEICTDEHTLYIPKNVTHVCQTMCTHCSNLSGLIGLKGQSNDSNT